MEQWLRDGLSQCLGFEVPDDMIKYITAMKSSEEFDEYFESLLNKECEEHLLFLSDCKKRLFNKMLPNKKGLQHTQPQQDINSKKSHNSGTSLIKQNNPAMVKQGANNSQQHQGAKKKTKFVNLYSNDGAVAAQTIILKGRRLCNCQASQHKLINNCSSCGRIVCEQEGSGPCLYCNQIVCTNEELQVLKGSGKKSENLLKSLREKGGGESLKKALEQRDRLLEYDRNSEKRTTVIDDELDYFEENSVWHSDEQRADFERLKREMHEHKHSSRIGRKIKFDFAGRAIDDDDITVTEEYQRELLNEVARINAGTPYVSNWHSIKKNTDQNLGGSGSFDPKLEFTRPIYNLPRDEMMQSKNNVVNDGLERIYNRVQDKELMEMQDMRLCLSLHQPWASLLAAGIKKHEGRVWYTEHRGRLWIASTAKESRPEEIHEVENFYKRYYDDRQLKFPEHYPTGCLLGCVVIDDCLPQEEYRELYPNGESDSVYVFICSHPEMLPVVFPIKGQYKIYEIDAKLHNAACKALMRIKAKSTNNYSMKALK
uniref:ASCH domain-containing protein n=1 Tax=Glossina brevipalpis TaxID=37001 RepID=A0A1A9VZM3_9MUSC